MRKLFVMFSNENVWNCKINLKVLLEWFSYSFFCFQTLFRLALLVIIYVLSIFLFICFVLFMGCFFLAAFEANYQIKVII